MAAIAHPLAPAAPRHLRLAVPGEVTVPCPRPVLPYWRRRLVVGLLVVGVYLVGRALLAGLAPVPAGPVVGSPAGPVLVSRASYVVQPGDTLWSIARALQPSGDVRPLVDRLAGARHGRPLAVGERVALQGG